MNKCNRCGKKIKFGRAMYLEKFKFCPDCYAKAKLELGYIDVDEYYLLKEQRK